jgi:TonB family protein
MNRLQKKCVIATAGIHLLLLTILIVGPAFFNPQPKTDNSRVLDVIPANQIDAAFNSGVRGATPPAPAPVVIPLPQPTPPTPMVQPMPPPAPKPVVTPPPTLAKRLEKFFTSEPKPVKPTQEPPEPKQRQIQVNTQLVARPAPNSPIKSNPQPNTSALENVINNLRTNLSSPMEVNLPGNSTVAYANYGDVVVSVYHHAWSPPDGMDSDSVTIQFKVTIASDGTVITARIITPSGDASVNAAVQRMLDRVKVIAPFPDGATEKERNYTINFNATRTTE